MQDTNQGRITMENKTPQEQQTDQEKVNQSVQTCNIFGVFIKDIKK